jgi:DMSO/TMAO reductase YedYZ molybdopterin-dependent catalytic subunit
LKRQNQHMDIREHLPTHAVPAAAQERVGRGILRVDGLVAHSLELTPADLARLPRAVLEEPFRCEEGWSVPGLRWGGMRLSDIVVLAQPLPTASYVRAASGPWVVPVPLADAATVLVCDELNGEPLPVEHGAPWRLVPSGGLCYSNVKWLDHLELTAEPGEHAAERIARARLDQVRSPHNG